VDRVLGFQHLVVLVGFSLIFIAPDLSFRRRILVALQAHRSIPDDQLSFCPAKHAHRHIGFKFYPSNTIPGNRPDLKNLATAKRRAAMLTGKVANRLLVSVNR
jgi:hypothetical protein